jgi:hypothetical protein
MDLNFRNMVPFVSAAQAEWEGAAAQQAAAIAAELADARAADDDDALDALGARVELIWADGVARWNRLFAGERAARVAAAALRGAVRVRVRGVARAAPWVGWPCRASLRHAPARLVAQR